MIEPEKKLKDLSFTDLYIGDDYIEIKGLFGASMALAPVPDCVISDVERLKECCDEFHSKFNRSEFSVNYDGVIYRVTLSISSSLSLSYVIRQTPKKILPISDIGIPPEFIHLFSDKKYIGLVLIAGKMASGKTTTAASVLSYRTSCLGDLSVAIEDPIETVLSGRHGDGRCIQLEVDDHISYASALKTAMRMGANNLLIGEIRDSDSAYEALKAGMNGMFVIATIHANSISDAIERFDILCANKVSNSKSSVSRALSAVVSQSMDYPERDGKVIGRNVRVQAFNLLDPMISTKVRVSIEEGKFSGLNEIIKSLSSMKLNQ